MTTTVAADQRQHALLNASGAHKWLNCTPSARTEETLPESQSVYANEGRLAHEIGELKLRKTFVEPMGPQKFRNVLKKLQQDPLYQDEMLTHTDTYLEYVSKIVHSYPAPPYVAIEQRLDYSAFVPEGFGTGDCIIIGGSTLHVIDLKYGKGVPVSAEYNPQMMLYGLGAYVKYLMLYPINLVKLTIVQPRLDNISEWEVSINDLIQWGEQYVRPRAQRAYNGQGEFNPGEWCRFCRARATCRARADTHTALEDFGFKKPPLLTNAEIGEILVRAQELAKWAKDLEEYALSECLAGNEIPGWKAVEGRSVRQFTDTEEAFKTLIKAGYDEAVLYERKPLTLAAIEKLLGKKDFTKLLADYVVSPPGKPTLAPESDKREAITNRTSAAEDFGPVAQES
jgi:hypothetical protein